MGWCVSKRDCVLVYGIMCSKEDGLIVYGMRCSFKGWGVCIWDVVLVYRIGC